MIFTSQGKEGKVEMGKEEKGKIWSDEGTFSVAFLAAKNVRLDGEILSLLARQVQAKCG